jgi:hypothetical protein
MRAMIAASISTQRACATRAPALGVFRDPLFLAVCALLTLWSFNPVWGSVLYLHMTEGLGFSEQDFGNVTSAFFAGSLLPAFDRAMATACFCGLPAFISVLMFELTVLREEPFFRGMAVVLCSGSALNPLPDRGVPV